MAVQSLGICAHVERWIWDVWDVFSLVQTREHRRVLVCAPESKTFGFIPQLAVMDLFSQYGKKRRPEFQRLNVSILCERVIGMRVEETGSRIVGSAQRASKVRPDCVTIN